MKELTTNFSQPVDDDNNSLTIGKHGIIPI